jgi:hypothetical protein
VAVEAGVPVVAEEAALEAAAEVEVVEVAEEAAAPLEVETGAQVLAPERVQALETAPVQDWAQARD